MNETNVARRIYDNLIWARAIDGDSPLDDYATGDVWSRVKAAWQAPDRKFVRALYRAILFRPADRAGLAQWCGALAGGMSRAELVRSLVLSEEARKCCLDESWLTKLDKLPAPTRRPSIRSSLKEFFRRVIRPGKRPTPKGAK